MLTAWTVSWQLQALAMQDLGCCDSVSTVFQCGFKFSNSLSIGYELPISDRSVRQTVANLLGWWSERIQYDNREEVQTTQ